MFFFLKERVQRALLGLDGKLLTTFYFAQLFFLIVLYRSLWRAERAIEIPFLHDERQFSEPKLNFFSTLAGLRWLNPLRKSNGGNPRTTTRTWNSLVQIWRNRANRDKVLQLGMVIGMGESISKIIATKWGHDLLTSLHSSNIATISSNSVIKQLLWGRDQLRIHLFSGFQMWGIHFWS